MALKKDIVYRDILVADAYIRVVKYDGDKNKMYAQVGFAANDAADYFDIKYYEVPVDITGENPVKQVYLYLKTLPEFEGAVDC